jgi:hypothetical protein
LKEGRCGVYKGAGGHFLSGFYKANTASARKEQLKLNPDFKRRAHSEDGAPTQLHQSLASAMPWLHSHVPDIVRGCP